MRANIVKLISAAGILALFFSFTSASIRNVGDTDLVVRPMTTAEMDCTVGGVADCYGEGSQSAYWCLAEAGINPEDPESVASNVVDAGYCLLRGLVVAALCYIASFFSFL